jgi:hypothetical protein
VGIQKNITMHRLRHTFASFQLADTPLHDITLMLGYASIPINHIYIRILAQNFAATEGADYGERYEWELTFNTPYAVGGSAISSLDLCGLN